MGGTKLSNFLSYIANSLMNVDDMWIRPLLAIKNTVSLLQSLLLTIAIANSLSQSEKVLIPLTYIEQFRLFEMS
jgi:hypothetical protein